MIPVIGLTVGEITSEEHPWAPKVYGQSHTYVDAVVRAGGAPFLMPLTHDEQILRALYERCDGLLLAGGNDIDPQLYGAQPSPLTVKVSTRRDSQELKLIEWAFADKKPVLGICRGMQLLNVARGGDLYQDVETEVPGAQNHHISTDRKNFADTAHRLAIEPDSKLAHILQTKTIGTNAHHHQSVRQLGKGLRTTAQTSDGIIEAIELEGDHFVVAVQSHPESLEAETELRWQKLFTAFVGQCRRPPALSKL
jgi:putative glutamine amidotransferase